jgi:hypothetical protein
MSTRKAFLQVWLFRTGQASANDEVIIDHKSVLKVYFTKSNASEVVAESTISGSKPVKLAFPYFQWVMLQVNSTFTEIEIKIFDVRGETMGYIK